MVFASIAFIFIILPLFLLCDSACRVSLSPHAKKELAASFRNAVLLAVSLLFYLWGEATSIFLLIALGLINYGAGVVIERSEKNRLRWLIVFTTLNLGVLIGFKYLYWLLSFVAPGLMHKAPSLPLGISFFTFHAISYIADIYRGHIKPARNVLDFMTYFCMFPHLVAGPIVRYAHVQDELVSRGPDRDLFSFGVYRFLLGLNKKVLIANSAAALADAAFRLSGGGHLGLWDAWIGLAAYTVQIYYDFSGYSDMAIGLAAMAGFRFDENFLRPYSAVSMQDFWRRWHISLSSWLRDYLYIPLGGSRNGAFCTYRNLLTVFFLCGLWHGANITFILWGLWHGFFLVLERVCLGSVLKKIPYVFTRIYTLLAVMIGWVLFRSENLGSAGDYLAALFTPSSAPMCLDYYGTGMACMVLGFALCLVPDRFLPTAAHSRRPEAAPFAALACHAVLAVLSVAMLVTASRNPFIYFNF